MHPGKLRSYLPKIFWASALLALVIWGLYPAYHIGWDTDVYQDAIRSLRAQHDPYMDGMARQQLWHEHLAEHPYQPYPCTYVYSPITLPLLKLIASLPFTASGAGYWVLYGLAMIVILWVGLQFIEPDEKFAFALFAPAAVFFPGLLLHDVLWSGNVAYLLYALLLGTAYLGWNKGSWIWFYLAVLLASCVKAPLLIFLLLPILSARRQWLPTSITAALGLGLFAVQPHIWPALFHHYLQAIELQFSVNRDFGLAPNGILSDALFGKIPYQFVSLGFYLVYAIPVFGFLVYFSRRFFAGIYSLQQWIPVLMTGLILLYPRIMEYDLAPVAVFMALVIWRTFAHKNTFGRTALEAILFFVSINAFASYAWRPTEAVLLPVVFAAGSWNLWLARRQAVIEEDIDSFRQLAA